MKWRVHLAGDTGELRELAAVAQTPELIIRQDDDGYLLESTRFEDATTPDEVRAGALTLVGFLMGATALALGPPAKPITEGAIETTAEDGSKQLYAWANSGVSCVVIAHATVSRTLPDGTVETIHPLEPVPGWIAAARRYHEVGDVLRQLGEGGRDWNSLYQLREKVAAAIGGDERIAARGWATGAELRCFNHTANSHAVLGDAARHGVQITEPPANPMTLGEARQLIERLIRSWFGGLRASAR